MGCSMHAGRQMTAPARLRHEAAAGSAADEDAGDTDDDDSGVESPFIFDRSLHRNNQQHLQCVAFDNNKNQPYGDSVLVDISH